MKKPTFSISNALFSKITGSIDNLLGNALFGPPKRLGLPEDIWLGGRITGDDDDEMQALRRAYFYNRVRIMASRVYMILSLPLAIAAAVISLVMTSPLADIPITPLLLSMPGAEKVAPLISGKTARELDLEKRAEFLFKQWKREGENPCEVARILSTSTEREFAKTDPLWRKTVRDYANAQGCNI